MKQTVEEAAKENILFNHRTVDRTLFGKDLARFGEINFIQGAEWQSKQSPWISVEEKLGCDTSDDCIVMDEYGEVFRAYFSSENKWLKSDNAYTEEVANVVSWMPIPTFDQILEANKDVLQRIKNKEL